MLARSAPVRDPPTPQVCSLSFAFSNLPLIISFIYKRKLIRDEVEEMTQQTCLTNYRIHVGNESDISVKLPFLIKYSIQICLNLGRLFYSTPRSHLCPKPEGIADRLRRRSIIIGLLGGSNRGLSILIRIRIDRPV